MYRVLLAEADETLRGLLARNIVLAGNMYTLLASCPDAETAIQVMSTHTVDILVVGETLAMPGAAPVWQIAVESTKHIEVVVVRASAGLPAEPEGVLCLTRPFSPVDLQDILARARQQLGMQAPGGEVVSPVIRCALHELLYQNTEQQRAFALLESIGLNICGAFYTVAELYAEPLDFWETKPAKQLFSCLESLVHPSIQYAVMPKGPGALTLVFMGSESQTEFEKSISRALKGALDMLGGPEGTYVRCALGPTQENRDNLPLSARLANRMVMAMRQKDLPFCIAPERPASSFELVRPIEQEADLLQQLRLGNAEASQRALGGILAHYKSLVLEGQNTFTTASLLGLVDQLAAMARQDGVEHPVWQDEQASYWVTRHLETQGLLEAELLLRRCVETYCEAIQLRQPDQGKRLVGHLKQLMEENIDNVDFTMDTVLESVHFSPQYIRQVFKRHTGETFMEHLIRRRMETAADCLQRGMKVQEAAARTGYSNQRYFASCFKKHYGCTPTEYKGIKVAI